MYIQGQFVAIRNRSVRSRGRELLFLPDAIFCAIPRGQKQEESRTQGNGVFSLGNELLVEPQRW
jgi:hypothetical protein